MQLNRNITIKCQVIYNITYYFNKTIEDINSKRVIEIIKEIPKLPIDNIHLEYL